MPINPNIALGAQQPQQPNMLAQMGQMLALKGAVQEIQGGEAMRDFFAKGGDLSTPEGQRQIMTVAPKLGGQLIKQQADIRKTQIDTLKDEIALRRDALANVSSPEDYLKWHEANHTGQLGAFFKSAGINPSRESIVAQLSQPGGLDKLKRASALGATQLEKELMQTARSVQVANIGAGATMRGQDLLEARERDKMALTAQERNVVPGEGEYYQTDRFGNIYRVPGFGALRGPNAPAQPLPPAAANAFVTTQPPVANALAPTQPTQPSVNALVQPGSPTVANALALEQQQGIPKPKTPIRQPVAVMKDGKAVLVPPEQAVGLPPASADAEKAARLQAQQVRDLGLAITNLESAIKPGGLITQSTGSGLGRAYDVAAGFVGQAPEGAIAAAKLAPIADMVLKMVPRFEGPQSDKDTQSYKEAAGQLANPNLPTKIRQEAGKEILRLMKERRDQFVSADMAREGFGAAPSGNARNFSPQEQQALEWANANASDPRAAQIKQRLGM